MKLHRYASWSDPALPEVPTDEINIKNLIRLFISYIKLMYLIFSVLCVEK